MFTRVKLKFFGTGRPEPVVSWLIDGSPSPQYIGVKTDTHVVVNRLELQHLKREDLNRTFKCRAANTHLVPPQEKIVRLEMNRKLQLILAGFNFVVDL